MDGNQPLKIYRLKVSPSEFSGYRSCVVVAASEWHARHTHPSGCTWEDWDTYRKHSSEWVPQRYTDLIEVTEVGTANGDQLPGVLEANYVELD
jgi:hypothetical protein